MAKRNTAVSNDDPEALCSIVILGEDDLAHARAMALCDRLAKQFWGDVEFECKGWLFARLASPESAFEAARAAAVAGLVIFAVRPENELPEHVQSWIEMWVGKRLEREGALISLVGEGAAPAHEAAPKQMYLRQVARRAKMDFLSDVSQVLPHTMPESHEWFLTRAGSLGAVMDGILKQTGTPRRPPGLDSWV